MLDRYAHLSPAHIWKAVENLTRFGTGSKTGSGQIQGDRDQPEYLKENGEPLE